MAYYPYTAPIPLKIVVDSVQSKQGYFEEVYLKGENLTVIIHELNSRLLQLEVENKNLKKQLEENNISGTLDDTRQRVRAFKFQ